MVPILVFSCVIVAPWCSLKSVNSFLFAVCYLGTEIGVIFVLSFSSENGQKNISQSSSTCSNCNIIQSVAVSNPDFVLSVF